MNENKTTAVEKMNRWGCEGIPFLFVIDFDFKKPVVLRLEDTIQESIFFEISGFASSSAYQDKSIEQIEFEKFPIDYTNYKIAFDYVMKNIKLGNTYLLNLTFPTKLRSNLTLSDIYLKSNANYKLLFKDRFVCFSPETFVKIEDGVISSYPMKGTIDADLPDALEIILNDKKETAEHNTIVDLIRNDLSIVAQDVTVTKFRYPDYISTNQKRLIQISSEINGSILPEFENKFGDIFSALLPAGSITGAPKMKTVEIIKQAESYERGFYTGVFGYFDGKKLDSAVMIRFIENTNTGLVFKSGGGITFLSDCRMEYEELVDKVYLSI